MWERCYLRVIKLLSSYILDEIAGGKFEESISTHIYYHAFLALTYPNEQKHFESLENLIKNNWQVFPVWEMRDIYLIAINYCIKKLNQGQREFIQKAFELYKQGLRNKILIEDGKISGFDYKNTLRLSLALKEFVWAEKFIEEYTKYLPAAERKNAYQYNLAFFYFNKPDYEKAMDLLRHVEFNDVFNNLDARRMLLRMYYELQEFDALDSLLDSFTVYIRRQKSISYHKTNYLNLIKFMRRILRGDLNSPTKKKQLQQKILNTESIAEKEWLMQQVVD